MLYVKTEFLSCFRGLLVWHLLLPFMNSFNTEVTISHEDYASWGLFLRLVLNYNTVLSLCVQERAYFARFGRGPLGRGGMARGVVRGIRRPAVRARPKLGARKTAGRGRGMTVDAKSAR